LVSSIDYMLCSLLVGHAPSTVNFSFSHLSLATILHMSNFMWKWS